MIGRIPSQAEHLSWRLDESSELMQGRRKCTSAAEAAKFASTIERLATVAKCVVEVRTDGEGVSVVTLATPRGQAFAQGLAACGL